jgi:hypothetical protein
VKHEHFRIIQKTVVSFPRCQDQTGDAYEDHVTIDFGGDHGFFVVMEDERDNYES